MIHNIPKMFPNDLLDVEFVQEESSQEMFLYIRKTTEELKAKKQKIEERNLNLIELNRFAYAK